MPRITRIRISNPHKRRRRKASVKRSAPKVSRRRHVRRRRHKSNPGGGEIIVATKNPHKRHRRRRSHRRNPFIVKMKHNGHRRHRRNGSRRSFRRRHNPSRSVAGLSFSLKNIALTAAAGTGGAIATRGLTQMILQDKNTGPMGYGANVLAALLLGYAAKKVSGSGQIAGAVVTGGLVATGLRIWQERVSKTSPAAAMQGLGDVDFSDNGLGAYVETPFYLPSISAPGSNGYLVNTAPAAGKDAAALNGPATAPQQTQIIPRYASRY